MISLKLHSAFFLRNSKFVRWGVVLLGLVVLRTKAQNKFCPMCTKECYTVLTRSKPFWGQVYKTDSDPHRTNKCAALVPLRNTYTNITGSLQGGSPTNQYISFTLWQEVVRKPTPNQPRTPPLSPQETPLFGHIHTPSARCPSSQTPP